MAVVETSTVLQGAISTSPQNIFLLCDMGEFSGFYASQEDSIKIQSDITDQFVEDNSAIQDHIGIKPLTFTLRGKIGDLVYSPNTLQEKAELNLALQVNYAAAIVSKTNQVLNLLTPTMSNYMAVVQGAYSQVEDMYNKYSSSLKSIGQFAAANNSWFAGTKLGQKLKVVGGMKNSYAGERTNPKRIRQIVERLWLAQLDRTAFTIRNNFGTFDNCYITDVDIKQTDHYTAEVSISLKQLRCVSTQTTYIDRDTYAGFMAAQKASEENLQQVRGTTALRDGEFFHATKQEWNNR